MSGSQVRGHNFPLVKKALGAFFPDNGAFKKHAGIRTLWNSATEVCQVRQWNNENLPWVSGFIFHFPATVIINDNPAKPPSRPTAIFSQNIQKWLNASRTQVNVALGGHFFSCPGSDGWLPRRLPGQPQKRTRKRSGAATRFS